MLQYREIIARQRAFCVGGGTRDTAFRKAQLLRLQSVIREKHGAIEAALAKDLHKCEFDAFVIEIAAIIDEINFAV
ncbi:MAG: hypothetical protein LBR18_04300, partial [Tannerella sp.]|nr:hypothetical protein [Tannerella sp.]